jgi:hypothetical protein
MVLKTSRRIGAASPAHARRNYGEITARPCHFGGALAPFRERASAESTTPPGSQARASGLSRSSPRGFRDERLQFGIDVTPPVGHVLVRPLIFTSRPSGSAPR